MECLSDKPQQDRRMALSYMQEAQITAGLLASHGLNMKQEPGEKHHRHLGMHQHHQSSSPPLNNNTTAAASLFSGMGAAAAAAASLSMLTPQQFLASQMSLLAAGIPVSLNPSFAATSPSLYRHHQTLFGGWAPPSASSPPSSLPGPVSPALSTKSAQNARRTPNGFNNNNNNNNNNVVSSSADRLTLKKSQAGRKKAVKAAAAPAGGQQQVVVKSEAKLAEGPAASPPSSISPEAGKDGRDKVFTCSICSRSFGYKHVLQNHERTHTGEKPYKCKECHKRFTRDHHLKTHMRLHTGEKPYHCNHCDRQFVQVANLRRHLRVHTGERPYACEVCAAKFSDSNQLKAHVLIHKNEKPEKCEHCHMRFRRRHHLVHHKCSALMSAGGVGTTMLPGSLVSAQLGARSVASDELEDDIDVDVDAEPMDEAEEAALQQQQQQQQQQRHLVLNTAPSLRQLQSPASLPIGLAGISVDLPVQTEPEDLSMPATRMRADNLHSHYSRSHSSGGGSPMSHSPSSDIGHDDDEEIDEVDDLDVARASPSSLFAPDARRVR